MRIAMISMHTSPLEQAGTGDAGGMNVYIRNTAEQLAVQGVEVDVFTRATRPMQGEVVDVAPGMRVINCVAGPYEGLAKEDLPTQLAAFTGSVLAFAREHTLEYDAIHSHYWLSGQVAWLLRDLWCIPWVHTSHTLAAVKNAMLAPGDAREPEARRICEQQIVDNADLLIVNTEAEVADVEEGYDSHKATIAVVPPGANIKQFTPGSDRATENARRALGIPLRAKVIGFVGRLQQLKGPHILLQAAAELIHKYPEESIRVVICGGPSGSGWEQPEMLENMAEDLGIRDYARFFPPRPPEELVQVYQAVDIIAMPSMNESFGLVAVEAQATGTPVVASKVGGLQIAVADGKSGVLVEGQEISAWIEALGDLVVDDAKRIEMAEYAPKHAAKFSWENTATKLVDLYEKLLPVQPCEARERHPAG